MAQVAPGRLTIPADTSDQPLSVRLVKEPQPAAPTWPRYLLGGVFAILLIIYVGLAVAYLFPESPSAFSSGATVPTLNAQLRYAEFVSVGEVGFIEVTAINAGDEPVTGTLVVAFDTAASVSLLPDNQSGLEFTNLPPGGRTTHRLEFRPLGPWGLPVEDSLPFHLRLLTPDGELETLDEGEIGLTPIPYLSRGLAWIRTSVWASLAALLWERIKKWLFP
jgi:hypothetical protein